MTDALSAALAERDRRAALKSAMAEKDRRAAGGSAAERIAAAKAGTLKLSPEAEARANAADQQAMDQMGVNTPGVVGGASGAALDGLLFGFGDEILAALSAAGGLQPDGKGGASWGNYVKPIAERYQVALDQIRREQSNFAKDRPEIAIPAEVAGAVASPINKVFGPASTIAKAAGQGAVAGAIYGAGEAEGNENIVQSAKEGAITGALFGAGAKMTMDFGSKAFRSLFKKSAQRPTLENLRATKTAAYNAVDSSGQRFSPQELQGMVGKVRNALDDVNYVEEVDRQTWAAMKMLDKASEKPMTIGQLDKMRQSLWKRYNAAPNEVGILEAIDAVDDLIQSRGATSDLMDAARLANSRYKKAELLEIAFKKAERETAASGSGGNILNKYRQAVTKVLNDPKRAKWFSADERQIMEQFVSGTMPENVLRRIGKLSPSGNGLMMALNLGAAAVDPSMLAFTAAGAGAKEIADRSVERGKERLLNAVSGFTPQTAQTSAPAPVNALAGYAATQFNQR